MPIEFVLPELSETVVEGEILKWLVEEGQTLSKDQPFVEVMTDKITVELPSPFDAVLLKKLAKEGDIVAVHGPLALFEGGDAAPAAEAPKEEVIEKSVVESDYGAKAEVVPVDQLFAGAKKAAPASSGQAKAATNKFGRVLAVPAARQAARDADIDIAQVPGSGPNGRVGVEDVKAYLASASSAPVAAVAAPAAVASGAGGLPAPIQYKTPKGYEQREVREPFKGIRKAIAKQMVASHFQTVSTLTVDEVDLTELVKLRARMKDAAAKQGVKLTYLPFIVKAVASALQKFPNLNSAIDEANQEIVRKNYYNIGIAVDTEAGLLVPVVRDVDSKSIYGIANGIADVAGKARSGKLSAEESTGGTFSITNMGSAGSLLSAPIINVPEAAILGVHTIQERPVARNGEIVLRHMMYLSLSFDHRLIDGAEAARFVREIVRLLENPDTLLLEAI